MQDLYYFLKRSGDVVTAENIATAVQFGVVRGAAVSSLLRLMTGVRPARAELATS